MSDEPDVTKIDDEPTVVEGDPESPTGDGSPTPTFEDWPDWNRAGLVRQTVTTDWEIVGPLPGDYDAFHNGERVRATYGGYLARQLMNPHVMIAVDDPSDLGELVDVQEELAPQEAPAKRPSRAKKGQGS